MSGHVVQLRHERASGLGGKGLGRVVCAAALALGQLCWASESRPVVERQGRRIAANKSVALDSPASSQRTTSVEGDLPEPRAIPHPCGGDGAGHKPGIVDVASTAETRSAVDTPVSTSAESPTLVRARDSGISAGQASDGRVPWYRTGIGALAIVLAIMAAGYWLIRRWMPGTRSAESGVLRVVARTAITPKHSATLIQMGPRFVLVGVSPDRVETLCEITDPDEVAELTARVGSGAFAQTRAFDRVLAGEAAGFRSEAEDTSERPPGESPAGASGPSCGSAGEPARRSGPLTDLLQRLRALRAESHQCRINR